MNESGIMTPAERQRHRDRARDGELPSQNITGGAGSTGFPCNGADSIMDAVFDIEAEEQLAAWDAQHDAIVAEAQERGTCRCGGRLRSGTAEDCHPCHQRDLCLDQTTITNVRRRHV